MIGQINQFGTGGQPINPTEAIKRYETCAAAGFALCDYRLGAIYAYGSINQPKDLDKGISHLKRCSKADILDCDAELGFWYREEPSLKAPDAEVVAHLQKIGRGRQVFGRGKSGLCLFRGYFWPKAGSQVVGGMAGQINDPAGRGFSARLAGVQTQRVKSAKFWKAFHQELTRLGVYSGPISTELTTETVAALFKL